MRVLAVLLMMSLLPIAARPAEPKLRVVASILPVHSLVAAVTEGVVTPVLILPGNASPHFHQLRPSQARALHDAEVVFWIGAGMESFLARALETPGPDTRVVNLMESAGIHTLGNREHVDWLAGNPETEAEESQDHEDRLAVDPHVWLSPDNARLMVYEIARVLAEVDENNRALYTRNGDNAVARLSELSETMTADLKKVRQTPYVVFHDAYRYFEDYFQLAALGAITVNPDRPPSAKRVAMIRELITRHEVTCVFVEPQHNQSWVNALSHDHAIQVSILDPLGAQLEPGPDAYFTLMQANASALIDCLSP